LKWEIASDQFDDWYAGIAFLIDCAHLAGSLKPSDDSFASFSLSWDNLRASAYSVFE
jgi:hypothetical protein